MTPEDEVEPAYLRERLARIYRALEAQSALTLEQWNAKLDAFGALDELAQALKVHSTDGEER